MGEQLRYGCHSRQDDNFSDRQQIKVALTLQSIKFSRRKRWKTGWNRPTLEEANLLLASLSSIIQAQKSKDPILDPDAVDPK